MVGADPAWFETGWSDRENTRLAELLLAEYAGETFAQFQTRISPRHLPARHAEPIMRLWERTRRERVFAVVEVPPRHGKLVADSTPILTPLGWRTHGDLRVGDEVYAPDGSPTRIHHVTPKGPATLAVRFADHEVIRVNPDHRWRVSDRKRGAWRVLSTSELIAEGLTYGTKRDGSPRGRFLVETPKAVKGSAIALPIDPYVFGLWLGDGSTGNGRITGSPTDIEHHKAEVRARGYEIGATNIHKTTGVVTFCVLGMKIRSVVGMTKFVPNVYYRATEEDRRELLRGMIDSDGCVDASGRCRFVNSNRRLVDDCAKLVSSLGYRVTIEYRKADPERAKLTHNRIVTRLDGFVASWTPTDGVQPARLPRKDIRHRALERMRSIVSIEPCASEMGHCIAVDHLSHCYLVGERCVPTHNTTIGLHGLAWRTMRDPALTNGFATFGDDYAASRSRICRVLARAGGVGISKDMANLHEWRTNYGGGCIFRGYQGEWTGQGITGVALIDDPFKDRAAAESSKIRQNVFDWFTDVLWTRLEDRSSVIVQHTRWHDDDLIGRLLAGKFAGYTFERIRLPAICEDEDDPLGREIGEALWPEKVSAEELGRIEASIGPYSWASLFQQRPRPKGADVFGEPSRFSLATWTPDEHRILLCCDPAATDDNRADFSAAFILAARGFGDDMRVWVLHGWRDQVIVPTVVRKLLEISNRYWRAPVAVESVGAFKAVPQMFREIDAVLGRRIREIKPVGDKFTRAQAVAAAWNNGRVLVPIDADFDLIDGRFKHQPRKLRPGVPSGITWADELIHETGKFTGVGDAEDDQVDAISHGFNELHQSKPIERGAKKHRGPFG